jgi:hypothetical protein
MIPKKGKYYLVHLHFYKQSVRRLVYYEKEAVFGGNLYLCILVSPYTGERFYYSDDEIEREISEDMLIIEQTKIQLEEQK